MMIHRFLVGHSLQTLQVASSEKNPAATENLPSCVFAVVLVTFTVAARGSLFSNAWAKERFQIGKPGGGCCHMTCPLKRDHLKQDMNHLPIIIYEGILVGFQGCYVFFDQAILESLGIYTFLSDALQFFFEDPHREFLSFISL